MENEIKIPLPDKATQEIIIGMGRQLEKLENIIAAEVVYPPSASELREYFKSVNLTGAQVGEICGVNSRTVRKWTGGEKDIPYAAWKLIVLTMQAKEVFEGQ